MEADQAAADIGKEATKMATMSAPSVMLSTAAIVCIGGFTFLIGVVFLYRMGMFHRVKLDVVVSPQIKVAYKVHKGHYRSFADHLAAMDKVLTSTGKLKGPTGHIDKFAIFFDNPKHVPVASRRHAVGAVITHAAANKTDQEALEKELQGLEFMLADLPAAKCVHTWFPQNGRLALMLSVRRVYSTIYKFVEDNKLMPKPTDVPICFELRNTERNRADYFIPVDPYVDLSPFHLGQKPTKEYRDSFSAEGKKKFKRV